MIDKLITQLSQKNAICYSGYRLGHSPQNGVYPSYQDVKQDLLLLAKQWSVLRLYDCSHHAQLVLNVIRNEKLPITVMLGADLAAEMNNPECPWGEHYSDQILTQNRHANRQQMRKMIDFAHAFEDEVFAVSIGNEASVDWNDHMVSVESLIEYARLVRQQINQPVTFCENYVPWTTKLVPLVQELDFISVHSYPAWEYHGIDTALAYTEQNYYSVADSFPDKPVVITEAGWTTAANGRGIEPCNASQDIQTSYLKQLMAWSKQKAILTFVFEAFDEPWKGSDEHNEPEKHWGLYFENRQPKPVIEALFRGVVSID